MALLYVFLCTYGTLTHTHARPDGDAQEGRHVAAVPAAASVGYVPVGPHLRATSDVPVCAFCEWQANSVSAALPFFLIPHPAQTCRLHPAHRADSLAYPLLAGPSSRAPPCV